MTAPHALARLYFLRTDEGGRQTDVAPKATLGYRPIFLEGDKVGNDCVVLADAVGGQIARGTTVELPIIFMHPQLIKPRLKKGDHFILWEGRTVAKGEILEVL